MIRLDAGFRDLLRRSECGCPVDAHDAGCHLERPEISHVEKRLAEAERRVAVLARALRRIQGGRVLADEAREIWQEIAKDALDEAGVERQT